MLVGVAFAVTEQWYISSLIRAVIIPQRQDQKTLRTGTYNLTTRPGETPKEKQSPIFFLLSSLLFVFLFVGPVGFWFY